MRERPLLIELLIRPSELPALDLNDWDRLLVEARNARVLARLGAHLEAAGVWEQVPAEARLQMRTARAVAEENQRALRWEVRRIRRALEGLDVPIVLLKGAAYIFAELPPAEGRLASDVDILVPKDRLDAVEHALEERGWEALKLDAYDQRYYRTWMHELPPLCHRDRDVVVDVHHNILPETGRLHPDPGELLRTARFVKGERVKVLAPEDVVLHSAAHLFQDGDLDGGLRDLIDLDDLLRHFGARNGFWERLLARSRGMDLERPLFYAMRYCSRWLDTPIPRASAPATPAAPARAIMDTLTRHALAPDGWEPPALGRRMARWLLYVRSHWLRMPPFLLARHLCIKAWTRTLSRPA